MVAVNTACDRELSLFMFVQAICLFLAPVFIKAITSPIEVTLSSVQGSGYTDFSRSSLSYTFKDEVESRSIMFSLYISR